jgi:hypothetical protein
LNEELVIELNLEESLPAKSSTYVLRTLQRSILRKGNRYAAQAQLKSLQQMLIIAKLILNRHTRVAPFEKNLYIIIYYYNINGKDLT